MLCGTVLFRVCKTLPMLRNNDTYDNLIAGIQPPEGWHVTVDIDPKNSAEMKELDNVKKKVGLYLPFIAKRLEIFKYRAHRNYYILIPESIIYIDKDGAFEVVFLVHKEDFRSPSMMGLKTDAADYLQDLGEAEVRFKFAVVEDYNKFTLSKRRFMLRYSYKDLPSIKKAS